MASAVALSGAFLPYGVLYARESDRLYILAIMHTKRKPGYWLDRRNGP